MIFEQPLMVRGAFAGAGFLALAAGGLAMVPPDGPARMSELRLQGLSGYAVFDSDKARVGQIAKVDADGSGRVRYLHILLDHGGEVKVAAFRAYLDRSRREIELMLPQDILFARAGGAPQGTAIEPSVGT